MCIRVFLVSDCGWAVGQEKTITLPAIAAGGTYDGTTWSVGENQDSQAVTLVLMDKGADQTFDLVTAVKNKSGGSRTKPSFIVGLKHTFKTSGYMNSTSSYGNTTWDTSSRRNWCNGGFRQAIESQLPGIFKQFKCIVSDHTVQDYFSLFSLKEATGEDSFGSTYENEQLKQIKYYSSYANNIKRAGHTGSGTGVIWWTRSLRRKNSFDDSFYCVSESGKGCDNNSTKSNYISPFGCL